MTRGRAMRESENEWDFFLCEREGATASILVNFGLRGVAPDRSRPWRLTVQLKVRNPSPNGLSNAEERPRLDQIDDALGALVTGACEARFAGRAIRSGFWTFVYYAPNASRFEETVDHAMRDFRDYTYSCAADRDSDWSHFFHVLLPTKREAQQIMNRHVLEQLKRHGDDLTMPRAVSHFIYFNTPFDRAKFLESVETDGFEITESESQDDSVRERRHGAVLRREDRVDFSTIQKIVLHLFDRASEADGEYDGWETQVIESE